MKTKKMRQILSAVMALAMIISCFGITAMAAPATDESGLAPIQKIAEATDEGVVTAIDSASADANEEVRIMVRLEEEPVYLSTGDLQTAAQQAPSLAAAQAQVEARIETTLSEKIDVENSFTLLFNGFSFTGESWMIDAINEMSGVTAFEVPVFELVEPEVEEEDEATVTPSMSKSTGLTTATDAWDLGYTGKGTTVAIIDTGILQSHEAFSVMPQGGKIDLGYLLDVYEKYGDKIHAGSLADVNDIYLNEKLPFNWDYFDDDAIPNHTASDHGTHVAGIAAGNNGDDFQGVAPDAQIVVMQVFTSSGGANFDTLMCAMEDCVYLGVDAINMSLGVPNGFTAYESIMDELEDVYDALEKAGISVAVAAGNDQHSNAMTNQGDWFLNQFRWLSTNPDVGIISAPATFPGSFAVASVVNTDRASSVYLEAYGNEYVPNPSARTAAPTMGALEAGEYEIVYVGLGSPEEIEAAGGVEGKIALVQRGTLNFTAKCTNAANAGAVGILIYNNVAGTLSAGANSTIPVGTLSMESGEQLLGTLTDGKGTITVIHDFTYNGVSMATSSSWGSTADLKIKPEIAAPGDKITSAVGFDDDDSYETWSGTSMATPHVAGGLLLIKQRLREEFPDASASELNDLAYAFMMSTAHQVQGFVRQQGAGLMDIKSALTTDAYLTVPGVSRPKLELDDSEDGTFTFTFNVTNIGDTEKTYAIVPSILTESVSDFEYNGSQMSNWEYGNETGFFVANPETVTVKTLNGTVKDVTDLCNVDAPETVTVPADTTVSVFVTIECSDELMAYFEENCPSGMFLEGFIKLVDQAEDGVDLSIPFLGYVGDWDYPSMIDNGYYWQRAFGENNFQQMPTSTGRFIGYGTLEQGLGLNYYADMTGETYLDDRNAISPNGDGLLDAVDYIEFSMLRNPKTVKLYVQDAEGNILETFYDSTYTFHKEYLTGTVNGGVTYSYLVFDFIADALKENETAYIVLETWLDHEEYDPADNASGRWVIPVTKDLTAPEIKVVDGGIEIIDANYTAYYAIYADAERTELLYEDGVFADERGVAEFYATDLTTFYVATADYARNEAFYMVADGVVYDMDEIAFEHSTKTMVAQQCIDYNEGVYRYGWLSFNTDAPNVITYETELTEEMTDLMISNYGFDIMSAAVAVDGTLYVNDMQNLYTMDPETFEQTLVNKFWYRNSTKNTVCYNIMTNPETYEMYAYAAITGLPAEMGYYGYFFCSLDPETAEVTPLWELNSPEAWAFEILDANTVIQWKDVQTGYLLLQDINDGTILESYELNLCDSKRGFNQVGFDGYCGDMIYDRDANCVYLTSDASWFGFSRYDATGMVKYDFDTGTTTLHTVSNAAGLCIYGLYFAEDVKPADFYAAMLLIDAIGEVTLDSGEAIEAARAAYEELSDLEKTYVYNYQTLLDAERAYVNLLAEQAALYEAKYYALNSIVAYVENADTTGYSDHQIEDFNAAVEAAKEAIEAAATPVEIDAALEALYAAVEAVKTSCPAKNFVDVDLSRWYHESVDFMVTNGYMNGVSATEFAPNADLTRAQLVTILYRIAGEPSVEGLANPFTDVESGKWYSNAVIWAANEGIVRGITDTTFAPNKVADREQLATIVYRFNGAEDVDTAVLDGYADGSTVSKYAVNAMAWAVENGIITGTTTTTLAPKDTATRAQVATILARYLAD